MDVAWPLVGREEELEFLRARLTGPEPGSVVLAGAAGVGKTRLASEALHFAESDGLAIARAVASRAASTIPLGAFVPFLPEGAEAPAGPAALMRSAASALARRGEGRRLVLAVDDAHDLDDASATLVHHLAAAGDLSLLLTVRSGERIPDPVTLLWKDRLADRLDLQPLSRAEVEELAVAALGGLHVDGALVERLWSSSRGNPLYLRELVSGAIESGAIAQDTGEWRLTKPLAAPSRLLELVDMRLAGQSDEDRGILELLAVDESLGLSALTDRFGTAPIERLERSGLIVVGTDERRRPVRLAHPLYAEALRAAMPAVRARSLQRLLADLIEQAGARRRGDVLRIALLRLDADGTAGTDLLAEAAQNAYFTYDLSMAERIARAALAGGAGWATSRLLADILRWEGRYEDADEVLAPIDLASVPTEEGRAMVAMTRAENLFRGLGRREESARVLREGEASVAGNEWRLEMASLRASFDLMSGDVRRALDVVAPIAAGSAGRAMAGAAIVAGFGLAVTGRTDDAVAIAERGFAAAASLSEEFHVTDAGGHVVTRCLALAEAGRLTEAGPVARASYEWALAAGVILGQAWFGMISGRVELGAGRLALAEHLLREGAVAFRDVNDPGPCRWCWAAVAQAAGQRGDVPGAEAALREMDAVPPTLVTLMEVEVERARAWALAARGEHSRARDLLIAAAANVGDRGLYALEADALYDVARLGDARCVADRLTELAGIVQGPLGPVRASSAVALASGDATALDDASAAFAEMGALLLAAEAAAQASTAWRRTGHQRNATASAARARELVGSCEGARTPALEIGEEIVALTRREQEIADLAAHGLSSREIAARLVLSVRTVENHLQRVYEKLGIGGRDELAERFKG